MLEVIKAHGITHFLYIGGNDSSDTVRILMAEAARSGHTLAGMHIPKTIDNDLMGNDHTPGFPSAAKFVAQAFAGADLDNAALPGVYVAVVMGRHAGFLTAAAALARQGVDDGPHLIYLPERAFEMDRFLADVKRTHERLGRCVVAVSEGIHDASGHPIITRLTQGKGGTAERDAHGNVQLSGTGALADLLSEEVKSRLGIKRVRGDTFGYLQRSFLGCVSDVDAREARDVGQAPSDGDSRLDRPDPTRRLCPRLCERVHRAALGGRGGQDPCDGSSLHPCGGPRCDAGLCGLSATAAGQPAAASRATQGQGGRQAAAAAGIGRRPRPEAAG